MRYLMHRLVIILILAFLLTGCSNIRSAKLLVPGWFGFTEISDDIYVDKAMPTTQREEFLMTAAEAKKRVSSFFGGRQMTPKVIACSSEACFTANGGVSAKGKAYGSSMLLLSPRGLNQVIMAHELAHIELHGRVGAIRAWRSIPQWFDEGLAVLVSDDPRFTEDRWLQATENGRSAPELEALGRSVPWGNSSWLLSYGTARRKVGEWYGRAGLYGLLHLINEVKQGEPFQTAFDMTASQPVPALHKDGL